MTLLGAPYAPHPQRKTSRSISAASETTAVTGLGDNPPMTDYPDSTARTMAQIRKEGSYFARRAAESEAKRERIVAEVARTAGPDDDIDYLTKRALYDVGLISASELHATGSSQLLPRGWYQHYVEAIDEYCPTRVFSLGEAGLDAAKLYDRGYRWVVVFSEQTGPRGDRTFIDVRSFGRRNDRAQSPHRAARALRTPPYGLPHRGSTQRHLPVATSDHPAAPQPASTPRTGLVPRSHRPIPASVVGRATLDQCGCSSRADPHRPDLNSPRPDPRRD